jgi:hypothetical protein
MNFTRCAIVVLATALSLACAGTPPAHSTASRTDAGQYLGTWILNHEKSKWSTGLPGQTTAIMTAVDGGGMKAVVDRAEPDGKHTHFEWTVRFDGKDYPVVGDPDRDAIAVKKIDDYNFEITRKKAGKVTTTSRVVIAADGKSRTETTTGMNPQGQKVENVSVWDKQ